MPIEPRFPLEGALQLAIRMRPSWRFIDEIRRFVESFCACVPNTPDHREAQLATAIHELVQNAIVPARDGEVEMILAVDPAADRVVVKVTNACTDEEFAELDRRLRSMNAEPDALRHYVETMRSSPTNVRGGLGLARVRYEGQLEITARRHDGLVTVVAEGRLRSPAPELMGQNNVEATPCCK